MKIGIDISQIVYETGVSNYTKNLVSKIIEIDKKNDYVLFGGSLRQQEKLRLFNNSKIFPLPPTLLNILWNQLHVLPVEKLIGNVDVFHTSDWTCPPTSAKKVVPIFDMVAYKYPNTLHPAILSTIKKCHQWAIKEADIIVTISESSKKDIYEILGIPPGKIRVVYPAVADQYQEYQGQKNSARPYFLAVGTREPRKNFNRLVEAFIQASIKDVDLYIVGKSGWGAETFSHPNIKKLGFVDQHEMPQLYANAVAFVYPSLYEGFGIPILEAMSVGCPVITSNVSSMPEVGGKAAIYIDPTSVDSIVDALKNFKYSKELGFAQVRKFNWEKSAREMVSIYEKLCG